VATSPAPRPLTVPAPSPAPSPAKPASITKAQTGAEALIRCLEREGVEYVFGLSGGAAMPIFGHSVWLLAISALVFGVAFFAVVGSTTAFVRFNYPPQAWPTAIAAMTISFGIGQTLGPIVVGAITDAVGSLSFALNISAAMLAIGAVASAFQGKLRART